MPDALHRIFFIMCILLFITIRRVNFITNLKKDFNFLYETGASKTLLKEFLLVTVMVKKSLHPPIVRLKFIV